MPSIEPIEGLCGAKVGSSMELYGRIMYCEAPPVTGRNRCKIHGGMTPRGIEAANYKGRGYSKDIPARLQERLLQSLDDPELISLGAEIALLDARIGEIFQKIPAGESGQAWDDMSNAIANLKTCLQEERYDDAFYWVGQAQKAVRKSRAERENWAEIYSVIGQRRQLADTERKREEMLSGTMTVRQAATLVTTLQTIILEEVHDADTRKRIGFRLRMLLGMPEYEGNMRESFNPMKKAKAIAEPGHFRQQFLESQGETDGATDGTS